MQIDQKVLGLIRHFSFNLLTRKPPAGLEDRNLHEERFKIARSFHIGISNNLMRRDDNQQATQFISKAHGK
jgi:hypothetical protein